MESGASLKRQITDLKETLSRLMTKYLAGHVSDSAYEAKSEELESDIRRLTERTLELQTERLDIDETLAFAEFITTHSAEVWNDLRLEGRQRLQSAIFSSGLTIDTEKCRTPATFLFYRDLSADADQKGRLVDLTVASWNPLTSWLRLVDGLRDAA